MASPPSNKRMKLSPEPFSSAVRKVLDELEEERGNVKSRAQEVEHIVSELKQEAQLVEIAGDLLQIRQSQAISAILPQAFYLKLPTRLPIAVHASEDDDPTAVAESVVTENGLPNGYAAYIAKWLSGHLRIERELNTGIAEFRRQQNGDLADCDRFNSHQASWLKVVEFLDVKDRVRCEQTSKWMRDLSANVLWRSYRSFDVTAVRPPARQVGGRGRGPHKVLHDAKWIAAIFDVLKRTEGALRHLRLAHDIPSARRRSIFRACQSTLESIVLETASRQALNVGFAFCRKIRKIDFSTTSSVPLWVLESIPASIEVMLNLRPPAGADLTSFLRSHQNLIQLDIRQRVQLSLMAIADSCPRLEKLSLSGVSFDFDDVSRLSRLIELRLTANAEQQGGFVDDDDVRDICANNPRLRVLSLRLSLGVNIRARRAFDAIGSLVWLEEFEASYVDELCAIDDDCIGRLVGGCGGSLRSFKLLGFLKELTDRSLHLIGQSCPRLRVLVLRSRTALSATAFELMIHAIVFAPNWCFGVDTLVIDGRIDGVSREEETLFHSLLLWNTDLRSSGVDFRCHIN